MSFLTFPPQAASSAAVTAAPVTLTQVAPRYDPIARDIVLGADGEPILGNPWETLADEVFMAILVRRGVYAEFPPDAGNTFDLDRLQPSPSLQKAAIQADIQSQIPGGDPTILSVGQFVFDFGPGDQASVSFVITPITGPTVPVTIPYGARS